MIIQQRITFPLISLIILLIILYKFFPNNIFADSPSFVRQIITDPSGDSFFLKTRANSSNITNPNGSIVKIQTGKNIKECVPMEKYRFHDIAAVSYFSDGKILNATLWLYSPFIEIPSNTSQWFYPSIKNVPLYRILYGMSVGINSAYDIEGSDYQVKYFRNIYDKAWTKIVEEMPPINQTKTLYEKYDYGDFVKAGQKHVDLSLDLGNVTYPNQYSLLFYTMYIFVKDDRLCGLSDISNRVFVPPPEFTLSASPSNAYLRPGEKGTIALKIKSNTNAKSEVFLSTNQTDNDIQLFPSPKKLSILPYGFATSRLEANVSKDAKPFDHTLPISANISIPTESKIRGSGISDDITKNPASANITENSNFTLTILPSLSFGEHLNNFYNTFITPISGIWTFLAAVAAVAAPLIIRVYRKQNKGENKKLRNWFNLGK